MKKLKLNSTLNHKHDHYSPYEVIVEKVITLYGKSFEKLKNNPFAKNPYIAEYCNLMCIDSNDVAHCLLFVDHESGDGILVESEGSDYARKSQFIPNARALIETNESCSEVNGVSHRSGVYKMYMVRITETFDKSANVRV